MNDFLFDAHCDTISKLYDEKAGLYENGFDVDIKRMKKVSDGYITVFAAFAEGEGAHMRVLKLIDKYYVETGKNEDIIHIENESDLWNAYVNKKTASLLSIEGGDALNSSIEVLRLFYRLGVRLLTLTWNYNNAVCDGILESRGGGLTDFGKEVVKEMNRLGMVIDVSHLSEKGFYDVAELSKYPFVASHSNVLSLCKNKRNLSDKQIKLLIEKKGCIGINFYPPFLNDSGSAGVYDIIRHIEYILSLGGENVIGFGSDFDGIDSHTVGVESIKAYSAIIEEFFKLGYSDSLIRKICGKNFIETFCRILK